MRRATHNPPAPSAAVVECPPERRSVAVRRIPALGSWALIVIALIAGMPGSRQAAAEDVVALYAAYWAGMPAAHIRLILRNSRPGYRDEIEIATEGLPYLFTRFHATALAEGRIVADRLAEPLRYFASYDLRKRQDRRVSMQFVRRSAAAPSPSAAQTIRAESRHSPSRSATMRSILCRRSSGSVRRCGRQSPAASSRSRFMTGRGASMSSAACYRGTGARAAFSAPS